MNELDKALYRVNRELLDSYNGLENIRRWAYDRSPKVSKDLEKEMKKLFLIMQKLHKLR
jgi:hypothetical protein